MLQTWKFLYTHNRIHGRIRAFTLNLIAQSALLEGFHDNSQIQPCHLVNQQRAIHNVGLWGSKAHCVMALWNSSNAKGQKKNIISGQFCNRGMYRQKLYTYGQLQNTNVHDISYYLQYTRCNVGIGITYGSRQNGHHALLSGH